MQVNYDTKGQFYKVIIGKSPVHGLFPVITLLNSGMVQKHLGAST